MTQFGLVSNAAPIAEKIKIIGVHAMIRQVVSMMGLSDPPSTLSFPLVPPPCSPLQSPLSALASA